MIQHSTKYQLLKQKYLIDVYCRLTFEMLMLEIWEKRFTKNPNIP